MVLLIKLFVLFCISMHFISVDLPKYMHIYADFFDLFNFNCIFMKMRFYDVGSYIYMREQKRGLETSAIIGIGVAAASTAASISSAVSQKSAADEANETNIQLANESLEQQEKLFHEANQFNSKEAKVAREFSSNEAALTRDWQEDMMQKSMEWYENYNSPKAQYSRYLDAGLNPTTLSGNLGNSPQFSVGGVSPASASSATAGSAPSVPLAKVNPSPFDISKVISNSLGDLGSLLGNLTQKEDLKSKQTFNEYYDEFQKAGLNISRNQARKLYKEGNMIDEQTDLFRINRDKVLEEIGLVQKQGQLYDKQGNLLDEQVIAQQLDNLWRNEDWQLSMHLKASQLHISQTQEKWLSSLLKAQIAQYLGLAANANAQADLAKATNDLRGEEKNVAIKYGNYLESQSKINDLELDIFDNDEMKNARKEYEKKKWELDLDQKDFENGFMMRSARWLNQISTPFTIIMSAWMLKNAGKPAAPTKFQGPTIQTNAPYNPYRPLE